MFFFFKRLAFSLLLSVCPRFCPPRRSDAGEIQRRQLRLEGLLNAVVLGNLQELMELLGWRANPIQDPDSCQAWKTQNSGCNSRLNICIYMYTAMVCLIWYASHVPLLKGVSTCDLRFFKFGTAFLITWSFKNRKKKTQKSHDFNPNQPFWVFTFHFRFWGPRFQQRLTLAFQACEECSYWTPSVLVETTSCFKLSGYTLMEGIIYSPED